MNLRALLFALLFATIGSALAKDNNLPIPVTVNESITVTLFFPSEITKVIAPAVHYKFEYEKNGTMGTLMARRGAASNLTVITKDGSIFSFLLQYDQQVHNFTYLLSTDQAIGVIAPNGISTVVSAADKNQLPASEGMAGTSSRLVRTVTNKVDEIKGTEISSFTAEDQGEKNAPMTTAPEVHKTQKEEKSLYDIDREGYYDIFCENNYDQEFDTSKSLKAGTGIELKLNAVTADNNEFYFIFQVTNRLTSSFSAEKLQFFVRTSLTDKPLKMIPVHTYNHQEHIEAGRTKKMVYVFEAFRLSKDQKVYVKLDEINGIRSTVLAIESEAINAAGKEYRSLGR